jgi:hypothetical protein
MMVFFALKSANSSRPDDIAAKRFHITLKPSVNSLMLRLKTQIITAVGDQKQVKNGIVMR